MLAHARTLLLCTILTLLTACGGQDDTSSNPWGITDPSQMPPPSSMDAEDPVTHDMHSDSSTSSPHDMDSPDLAISEEMDSPLDPSTLIALEAGKDHTCALERGGRMWCWGNNRQHQIDPGSEQDQFDSPILVAQDMRQIALFDRSTCGVDTSDRLVCWGQAARAVLPPQPIYVELMGGVRSISVGFDYLCAISLEDDLYCWGLNQRGQLGLGHRDHRLEPTRLPLDDVLHVASGVNHTCAITQSQDLYCWGRNAEGRVGVVPELLDDGSLVPEADVLSPLQVGQQTIQVDVSGLQTCALSADGALSCVEVRMPFLEGHDDATPTTPTFSPILDGVTSFGVGELHGCAITQNEEVSCWGMNNLGQLGPDVSIDHEHKEATPIHGLRATAIASGDYHSCALRTDGGVVCWGASKYGQLGVASEARYEPPVEVVFEESSAP